MLFTSNFLACGAVFGGRLGKLRAGCLPALRAGCQPAGPRGYPCQPAPQRTRAQCLSWLRLSCSVPLGTRYLALFFISDSTFLNPAGTSKSEGSTAFEENVLSSVVISSSDPCPPEAC